MTGKSPTCRWVSEAVERGTRLSRLQSGETVRAALRKSGLRTGAVTREEMLVVLRRALPRELSFAGVEDSVTFCEELARSLTAEELPGEEIHGDSAEEVFRRLFSHL